MHQVDDIVSISLTEGKPHLYRVLEVETREVETTNVIGHGPQTWRAGVYLLVKLVGGNRPFWVNAEDLDPV